MKRIPFLMLAFAASLFNALEAQVTIGKNDSPAAKLDVRMSDSATAPADGIIAPRMTLAELNAASSKYTPAQRGAFVYITSVSGSTLPGYSDGITCTGYVYFDGAAWISDCSVLRTYVVASRQPKAFTFYEEGVEPEEALLFVAGGSSAITYQWYKITGNNIHVRIAEKCTATDGTGFNTNSFTPKVALSLNTTNTRTASKTGFYRYYCVAKNTTGDSIISDLAEVAVGCGAKNLQGEWISFMCYNLGASLFSINQQKNANVIHPDYGSGGTSGGYTYVAGEEALYGDLFQWGRIADGHEKRNSTNIAYRSANPPVVESGNIIGPTQAYPENQVSRTDPQGYYGKFITGITANSGNWYPNVANAANNAAADALWKSTRFLPNDPCAHIKSDGLTYTTFYPAAEPGGNTSEVESGTGWRMPTADEWGSIYKGGNSGGYAADAMANTWKLYVNSATNGSGTGPNGVKGYEIQPDGKTTTLFLIAVGSRNYSSALLTYAGNNGHYNSASITGSMCMYLSIQASVTGNINPGDNSYRTTGRAIRCIKN
ncbi:MAG: hypothetical protein LBR64_07985 [Dysgonamonadaceae bacterium]|jgi:hypothetical protein|nr:hypothetical protein [Dysgonamonadaceae bacterium]